MGTVEEKQNRVVEVILSRVRPWQILVGKVVGIGLLGLLQLALLAGAAYFSAQMADLADVDLASIGLPIIAAMFFWFVLGYTFYAFLYAAVGSTVSRQEDLQGAMMLPIVLIVPGYLLALVAAESPDGLVPTIGSMLPPWAPFVMPVRIASVLRSRGRSSLRSSALQRLRRRLSGSARRSTPAPCFEPAERSSCSRLGELPASDAARSAFCRLLSPCPVGLSSIR